ncbi:MAG: TIGR01777 family oxidoreductase [Verrucomicrobiota bacterium]
MQIGITGATGLVGRAVGVLAQGSGHEVIGYSRQAIGPQPHLSKTLISTKECPLPETRLDALIHMAGETLFGLWTKAKLERIWKSRVDLTRQIVSELRSWRPENRPRVLLCASAVGYYGDRGDTVLEENTSSGNGHLAELCREWESAARQASAMGTRVVLLRTGVVLSNQGGAYPLMRRVFACGLGGRMGSGKQWMPWIHEQDEATLILWALENESVVGPVNLCAPHPVTNAEFTRRLAAHLKRPAFMHVPAFAMRLLPRRMADEMLLVSQRAFPRVATDLGYRFAYPQLDDALTELGGS